MVNIRKLETELWESADRLLGNIPLWQLMDALRQFRDLFCDRITFHRSLLLYNGMIYPHLTPFVNSYYWGLNHRAIYNNLESAHRSL